MLGLVGSCVAVGLALIGSVTSCQPDGSVITGDVYLVEEGHVFTPEEADEVGHGDQLDLIMVEDDTWMTRCEHLGGVPTLVDGPSPARCVDADH
jgi:hypothetical protein